MTDPMTLDRFRDLADAYGGAVARWPDRYHDAAASLAATPEGFAILTDAGALDARLDMWRVERASPDLAARIVATGTRAKRTAASRVKWWWSGIGIGATLAGAAFGTAAVAMVAPIDVAGNAGYASTSFGDITESDG